MGVSRWDKVCLYSGWVMLAYMAYHSWGGEKSILNFIKGVGYLLVAAGLLFVALPKFCEWLNERYGEGSGIQFLWLLWFLVWLIAGNCNNDSQTPMLPIWMY